MNQLANAKLGSEGLFGDWSRLVQSTVFRTRKRFIPLGPRSFMQRTAATGTAAPVAQHLAQTAITGTVTSTYASNAVAGRRPAPLRPADRRGGAPDKHRQRHQGQPFHDSKALESNVRSGPLSATRWTQMQHKSTRSKRLGDLATPWAGRARFAGSPCCRKWSLRPKMARKICWLARAKNRPRSGSDCCKCCAQPAP